MQVLQNQNVGFGFRFQGWLSSLCQYGGLGGAGDLTPRADVLGGGSFCCGAWQLVSAALGGGGAGSSSWTPGGRTGPVSSPQSLGGGGGGGGSGGGGVWCWRSRAAWCWEGLGHRFREPCPPAVRGLRQPSEVPVCPSLLCDSRFPAFPCLSSGEPPYCGALRGQGEALGGSSG